MTILIVDDSALTRKALQRVIEMVGIDVKTVLEAENGRTALGLLDSHPIDLVLADLNMPDMGGIEMIAAMQDDPRLSTIPVVIVSTEASQARIADLKAHGAHDYLHKPFTPEQVKAVIKPLLEVMSL